MRWIFEAFFNAEKHVENRPHLFIKKADVDGVSKSAFDLFKSDSARLLTRACISLKIVKILLNEIDVLGTR